MRKSSYSYSTFTEVKTQLKQTHSDSSHLPEAVHNGSSVDPDRRIGLALYAARAVVVDLTAAERLAEQRRVGVADERRQSFDDHRHAVHRQRGVELQAPSGSPPSSRAQAHPLLRGVHRPLPLRVNKAETRQIGAAVTEVGEVQLVHRLRQ